MNGFFWKKEGVGVVRENFETYQIMVLFLTYSIRGGGLPGKL